MLRTSYQQAFLSIYLGTLLLLPSWPRWILAGLPDPTFNEAVILPIAAVYCLKEIRNWRFSVMDALVAALLLVMAISEFLNTGYNEAQNLMFDRVAAGLLPYMLAKGIIEANRLTVAFVKRFVLCLCIVFPAMLFEARFGYNLFRTCFDPFFPGEGSGWVTTFRYGLARSSGPYSHAILAGMVFMIGAHLQFWLAKNRYWEPAFRAECLASIRKPIVLSMAVIGGLLLAIARGPQLGAILGWLCGYPGRGQDSAGRAKRLAAWAALIGLPIGLWTHSYVAVGRAAAGSASQETAAYRKELVDKYIPIVEQKGLFGWGLSTWPKVPGMPSIDNYYLLLSLQHGVLATGLLLAILFTVMIRAYRNGMRNAQSITPGTSLSFALLGIYAGLTFSLATVFLGESMIPIFFLLTGFTEGYLLAGGDRPRLTPETTIRFSVSNPNYSMPRVVT